MDDGSAGKKLKADVSLEKAKKEILWS